MQAFSLSICLEQGKVNSGDSRLASQEGVEQNSVPDTFLLLTHWYFSWWKSILCFSPPTRNSLTRKRLASESAGGHDPAILQLRHLKKSPLLLFISLAPSIIRIWWVKKNLGLSWQIGNHPEGWLCSLVLESDQWKEVIQVNLAHRNLARCS